MSDSVFISVSAVSSIVSLFSSEISSDMSSDGYVVVNSSSILEASSAYYKSTISSFSSKSYSVSEISVAISSST